MKRLELKISSEAFLDFEKIWVYTLKKWSKDQADRYYMLIIDEIEFLRSNYYTGKSTEYIRPSFMKSHIIFYKIEDEHKLEVIRILYQSMNIEDWLK